MKNISVKISIITLLCVTLTWFNGCKKKEVVYEVAFRPEKFPQILVPPDNATEVRYASPETAKIVPGCYSLHYFLDEEYPAEKTIEQMHNDLKAKGCVKVEWKSQDMAVYTEKEKGTRKYVFNAEETEKMHQRHLQEAIGYKSRWNVNNLQEPGFVYHTWSDEWISPDDELIVNTLLYRYAEGNKEMKKLFLSRLIYTPSSWRYKYVLKYKKLHPEEFVGNQNEKTTSDDRPLDGPD